MGLFKLFKPKSPALPQPQTAAVPEASKAIPPTPATNGTDLQAIYIYAKTDFEARGYQDALTNPDTAYKNENISLLLEDLDIQIKQAQNYYAARLIKLDFHIASRKAAGLIDTVKELENQKTIIVQQQTEVQQIIKDKTEGLGLVKRITLSYNRGFNRGLASISSNLLNPNS